MNGGVIGRTGLIAIQLQQIRNGYASAEAQQVISGYRMIVRVAILKVALAVVKDLHLFT